MQRFKSGILAAAGLLILAFVLTAVSPKGVMAALGYTPVREVNGPGSQPFALRLTLPPSSLRAVATIPHGKRLVITAVSAHTFSTTADWVQVFTRANGQDAEDSFPYVTRGAYSFANAAGAALAHGDQDTSLAVGNVSNDTATISVHGYYVDVP